MLSGRVPFSPDPNIHPDVSLRRKQVHESPPPPSAYYPGLSSQLDKLVLRALEKRPEARYQSAAEFKQAIIALDAQLGLTLTDTAETREFETSPFTPSTDKNSAKTTAATARMSATAGSAYYAPSTNVVTQQPGATTPVIERPRSSKSLLLIGVAVVALAAVMLFAIQKFYGNAQTNTNVAETVDPPRVPEGMALIPEGSFMMGRDLTDEEKKSTIEVQGRQVAIFSYDWPAHSKSVSAFYLDKTEVSNAQYAEFVKATGHPAPANWEAATPPAHALQIPVTDVTYQDAVDFCAWRSQKRNDGVKYRLPTEEEWEYAARGKDAGKPGAPMHLYPWGEQWVEGNANTKESRLDFPRNVDQYPNGKSASDILNLAGNVAEWTASDFSHYPGSDQKTPREPGYEGTYQVVRGGAFAYPKEYAMTTTRVWARPENKGPKLGFRCAADAKR
jgi:formylglycine-generating enzyme required for sulfatase activity